MTTVEREGVMIGGPSDGEWYSAPGGTVHVLVLVGQNRGEGDRGYGMVSYQFWVSGELGMGFWVAEGMSAQDAFKKLLERYGEFRDLASNDKNKVFLAQKDRIQELKKANRAMLAERQADRYRVEAAEARLADIKKRIEALPWILPGLEEVSAGESQEPAPKFKRPGMSRVFVVAEGASKAVDREIVRKVQDAESKSTSPSLAERVDKLEKLFYRLKAATYDAQEEQAWRRDRNRLRS